MTSSPLDPTAERIAENEARFREANDAIERSAHDLGVSGPIPFVCECSDVSCTEIVRLERAEYLGVRVDPRHFVTIPEHQAHGGGFAVPIEQHPRYAVVRKLGTAGEVAEELEREPPAPDAA